MKKFKSLLFLLLAINVFTLADNEVNSKQLEKIFSNITENKNTDKNFKIVNRPIYNEPHYTVYERHHLIFCKKKLMN